MAEAVGSKPIEALVISQELRDEHLQAIRSVDQRLVLRRAEAAEQYPRMLREAEILIANALVDLRFAEARELRWVHFLSAGVDRFFRCRYCLHQMHYQDERLVSPLDCINPSGHSPLRELPPPGVLITDSGGMSSAPIAEYVMGMMLAFVKKLPALLRAQEYRYWMEKTDVFRAGVARKSLPPEAIGSHSPYLASELNGLTLGIVGMGHIGAEVAKRARGFGMQVLATRRSVDRIVKGADAFPADEVYPSNALDRLLSRADYVLISTPLTCETEGLMGQRQLDAMKPSAILINVSRGRVVDEGAVIRALGQGQIAGAVLDVFAQEPLPESSSLWSIPNLVLSPHVAGVSDGYYNRCARQICDNLRRYLAGECLVNVVDRDKGY